MTVPGTSAVNVKPLQTLDSRLAKGGSSVEGEQRDRYQESVDEWKRRIREVRGWEEDKSELPIPEDVELWCSMDDYRWARTLDLSGIAIANPNVTISIHAYQAKSHLNRFIACVEDLPPEVTNAHVAALRAAAWTQGRVEFDATPLSDILSEFQRYRDFNVQIEDDTIRQLKLTGSFDAYDPEAALAYIATLPGIVVEKKNTQTFIVSRK